MANQNFFIISAVITQKIALSKKHSVTKKMFFAGTCAKGKPLFATDQTQAFPFLKKENAEIMSKCLNDSTAKIVQVGSDYSVLRQATDDKQKAQRSGNRENGQQAAPTISGETLDVETAISNLQARQRSQMPRYRL